MVSKMYVLAAISALVAGVFILHALNFKKGIYSSDGVSSISGLRAFLAIIVLLSHSTHYLYSLENEWIYNANYKEKFGVGNVYLNLGKVGVLMFFMISGFLFYRLIYKERLDTINLFKKRALRIVPCYWFSMLLIVVIGCFYYKLEINQESLYQLIRWALFIGGYSIGGINTSYINAGVDWTLKIEWMLYLSLPLIFMMTRGRSNKCKDIVILLSVLVILILSFIIRLYAGIYTDPRPVLGFASGLLAFRCMNKFTTLVGGPFSGMVAALCIIISFPLSSYAFSYIGMVFLCTIAFIVISSGNSIYKILSNKTMVSLGEVSYSIYLLHGIVLFLMTKITKGVVHYGFWGSFSFNLSLILISAYIAKYTFLKIEKRWFKKKLSIPKES